MNSENRSAVVPHVSAASISEAFDDFIAEDEAAKARQAAGLDGPPSTYEVALAAALNRLTAWLKLGKFRPLNEEDVQCFLYYGLVLHLGTAIDIHPKLTHGKPEKVEFLDGKLLVGDMRFPDLIIGDPEADDAVFVEIKFRRERSGSFHGSCLSDVKKLAKYYPNKRQFFILFDCHPEVVYLNQDQKQHLEQAAATGCTIWHFPEALSTAPGKLAAAKAIAKMRANGLDLSAMGKKNAAKAIKGKGSA